MVAVAVLVACAAALTAACLARRRTQTASVCLLVEPYRNDRATNESLLATFTALHSLLARQALALEIHLDRRSGGVPLIWFALRCPSGLARHVEAALRASYPNLRTRLLAKPPTGLAARVVLHRHAPPRARSAAAPAGAAADGDALLRAMAAAGAPASVQLVLRPAARIVEELVALEHGETHGAVNEPPGPLFWAEPRIFASDLPRARAIASALCADGAGARLVRSRGVRTSTPAALAQLRVRRSPRRVYRISELTGLWQLPSPEFAALPCLRRALPLAPAPPGISRPGAGRGLLRDEHGGVTIAVELRRQHTAVVGAVEQGKSSYLVASAKEDLAREDCAVIVLDPKGDAANAVLSIVPEERTCTLLDMAAPSCGFNPLAVAAAPDGIADQVVGALRALFSEGEVRGSSDRYLRNATIAALACDAGASLWDVARLLEVGPAGTRARAEAAERLIELPEYAEIATFLAEELPAQLADARATTTAKLDAPANKLARVLNSPAVKRVLLGDSLRIDFDEVIDGAQVLVVRGALGEIGAGNVAVLMQLLLGMLDAALARVQDRRAVGERRAVALKVDEAPLVINETFAQTLALKRSAGLETVACWQTDAQWPIELREQLDALFAHRVLFATASAADARAASGLLLSEFSDQLRPSDEQAVRLASPDVRLHLPRHTAIVSWTTVAGRERPFIATTLPMALDPARLAHHAARQRARSAPPPIQPPPEPVQSPARPAQLPAGATQSYDELVALDCAGRPRWLDVPASQRRVLLDADDRALLVWLAAARCATTSQIHTRLRAPRALTATQRQLKRLADMGLVARFQLHRADGGGLPHCCAVTAAAIELLDIRGRSAPELGEDALAGLLADIHVSGWLLAFERLAGSVAVEVLGPGRAAIAPPRGLGPSGLELPGGRRTRAFVRTGEFGGREPVTAFEAVRPDAVVELGLGATRCDLHVVREHDAGPSWLERYDHLVSGWWRLVPRYARLGAPPLVVVVCEDAQRLARSSDATLCATLARIGCDPSSWERPGRARIHFADEAAAHRGVLSAWRVAARPGGEPQAVELIEPGEAGAFPPWR
jgi:hypothetical protein